MSRLQFNKTKLKDVYIIEPMIMKDERGYFERFFCKDELKKRGIDFDVKQANRSLSNEKGILRGLHFQKDPKAEDKIVQCIRGKIFDVAVDVREGSPTYGEWISEELTEDNKKMLLVPKGCAHGFQTLTRNSEVMYFMSEFYSPEHATGLRWNDPLFNIPWPLSNPILSPKDQNWPLLTS